MIFFFFCYASVPWPQNIIHALTIVSSPVRSDFAVALSRHTLLAPFVGTYQTLGLPSHHRCFCPVPCGKKTKKKFFLKKQRNKRKSKKVKSRKRKKGGKERKQKQEKESKNRKRKQKQEKEKQKQKKNKKERKQAIDQLITSTEKTGDRSTNSVEER